MQPSLYMYEPVVAVFQKNKQWKNGNYNSSNDRVQMKYELFILYTNIEMFQVKDALPDIVTATPKVPKCWCFETQHISLSVKI